MQNSGSEFRLVKFCDVNRPVQLQKSERFQNYIASIGMQVVQQTIFGLKLTRLQNCKSSEKIPSDTVYASNGTFTSH